MAPLKFYRIFIGKSGLTLIKVVAFDSFEDMENHHAQYSATIDPIVGLAQTIALILNTYGLTREDILNRSVPRTLIIDQME